MPTQAQVNYLSQDETLPGGNAPIYLTDTLIRLTTSTKLEEDKLFKIKGFLVKVSLAKSRTAPAGSSITMVYDQRNGFDNTLSNLQYLKDNGKILGAGIGMFLEGMPNVKFSFANFKEKLAADPEFAQYFETLTKQTLAGIVKEPTSFRQIETVDEDTLTEEENE